MRLKVFLASLLLSTTAFAGPSLHYDFLSNPSLTSHPLGPDLSITRTTTAAMTDADGYIREVQAGEARFTGATFSNNLLTINSEDFTAVGWGKTNADVSTVAVTPPSGATTVSEIRDDGATGTGSVYVTESLPLEAVGKDFIHSAYVKAGSLTWTLVQIFGQGGTDNHGVYVNLSTGAEGTKIGDPTVTISDVGDGWYRVAVTYTGDSTDSGAGALSIRIFAAAGDNDTTITLDGTNYIYATGAMVEVVSGKADTSTPSTYIPTTTAAVSSLTGTSTKGLLVEEARTNIALQSEDFSTTWTLSAEADISTNQTTAPDGSSTADQLTDDGVGSTAFVNTRQSFSLTAQTYTASVFLEASGLDWAFIQIEDVDITGTEQDIGQYYDLTNGVVGTAEADTVASGIEDYGSGWFRCWITFTPTLVSTGVDFDIALADGDGDNIVAIDGTSSIFVWGASLEASSFPSSYIATTTGTVTRNADVVTTSDVTWYSSTAGTLYSKGSVADVSATTRRPITLGDGSDGYSHRLLTSGIGNHTGTNSDATAFNISPAASVTDGATFQMATGVAADDVAAYTDGGAGTPDTGYTVPTISSIHVGSLAGTTNIMNGHIAEIAYWPERLSNQILDDMSTTGNFPVDGKPGKAILRGLTVGVEHDEILCSNSDPDDMPACYASNGSNVQDIRIHRAWSGRAGVRDSGREGALPRGAERDLHDLDRVVGF